MALVPGRSRSRSRRFSAPELAIGFALVGSVLAVAIPTFLREVHASRFVEPVEGIQRIAASAVAYASAHPGPQPFPPTAPMTPSTPPRGRCEADPAELWERPTWVALEFQPVPPGEPHCFAFAFDSVTAAARSTFRAHAHGDLDGDGITSTFEVTGSVVEGDPRGPILDPGMFVDSEVE
jgi:type IV pilus assembly protein PilA